MHVHTDIHTYTHMDVCTRAHIPTHIPWILKFVMATTECGMSQEFVLQYQNVHQHFHTDV